MKDVVVAPKAPAAVGTYSAAIKSSKTVYLSGQLGLDPNTGSLPSTFEAQCRQAFRNVFAVVEAAGGTPHDIVRQTIYLTDLSNFEFSPHPILQEAVCRFPLYQKAA